jgi:predicted dinucleotide-binding enzyme
MVGNVHMCSPEFSEDKPDMFIAGNDAEAKKRVTEICADFGWPGTIDLGGIECSRYLEPMAMVWVLEYFRTGNPNHAFKMLRK